MMKQIGWVIKYHVDKSYHSNMRVYDTEKRAKRYAHTGEVVPVFIEES